MQCVTREANEEKADFSKSMEASTGIEPVYTDLQSAA